MKYDLCFKHYPKCYYVGGFAIHNATGKVNGKYTGTCRQMAETVYATAKKDMAFLEASHDAVDGIAHTTSNMDVFGRAVNASGRINMDVVITRNIIDAIEDGTMVASDIKDLYEHHNY